MLDGVMLKQSRLWTRVASKNGAKLINVINPFWKKKKKKHIRISGVVRAHRGGGDGLDRRWSSLQATVLNNISINVVMI